MSAPDLSIVTVSFNTRELLLACLASIPAGLGGVTAGEVIVVDNASADRSDEAVAERFPGARRIANAENRGFAAATNQGLAAARGRHLVLLNPDTEVRAGALARLVDFLDAHPRCGAVGPQL